VGISSSGERAGGGEGEAESSGEGENAHGYLLHCRPEPVCLSKKAVAVLLMQRPSCFGRAVVAGGSNRGG
jgi:hypothetical protein